MADRQLTVVVRLKAKPGMEARVREELASLLAPTRREQGCLNYDMHESPDDPSLFLFHENWTSRADLDRHLGTPHLRRWLGIADSLLAEPMQLGLWRKSD